MVNIFGGLDGIQEEILLDYRANVLERTGRMNLIFSKQAADWHLTNSDKFQKFFRFKSPRGNSWLLLFQEMLPNNFFVPVCLFGPKNCRQAGLVHSSGLIISFTYNFVKMYADFIGAADFTDTMKQFLLRNEDISVPEDFVPSQTKVFSTDPLIVELLLNVEDGRLSGLIHLNTSFIEMTHFERTKNF